MENCEIYSDGKKVELDRDDDFWCLMDEECTREALLKLYQKETGRKGYDDSGIITEAFDAWRAEYSVGVISKFAGKSRIDMAQYVVKELSKLLPAKDADKLQNSLSLKTINHFLGGEISVSELLAEKKG